MLHKQSGLRVQIGNTEIPHLNIELKKNRKGYWYLCITSIECDVKQMSGHFDFSGTLPLWEFGIKLQRGTEE